MTIGGGVTVTRSVADPAGRDAADRWTSATVQQSGRAAKAVGRSFDAAGRLTAQSGIGLTAAGSYGYDPVSGRKTGQSLPLALGGAINDSYAYYAGGRLAAATTNGSTARTTFDEVGNLVGEEIADVSSTVYGYDAANRLTSTATTAAVDGAAPEITYYGWDAANAWRTCQGPDPDPTQANSPIDFSYDASGRRTKSVVTVGGTQTTTSYDYDGLTLLSLSATQGATTWRIDYLYDEEGALYGGVYRSPAASASPTYFTAVTNDHGDVLELCDADGNAFAAYRYDAWGLPQGAGNYGTGVWTQATTLVNTTLAGQIATRQVLRYASYAYDAESGLYYCSARCYDPATRQWTTGDPAKADGEESAWQYCIGSPVCGTDASGEKTIGYRLADNKYRALQNRIRSFAIKRTNRKIPYEKGGTKYGKGPCDCVSFVRGVLYSAGVRGMTAPPEEYINGDVFRDMARWKGRCSMSYFDQSSKTRYRIGDVLIERGEHTVLVISNGKNPMIAECTANDGLGKDHYQNATGYKAHLIDGSARLRLRHRWRQHGWRPYESGRFFKSYPHNIPK